MVIYYVKIHVKIMYTRISYDKFYYFNSEKSMHDFIDRHKTYDISFIVEHGIAHWNKRGVLIP